MWNYVSIAPPRPPPDLSSSDINYHNIFQPLEKYTCMTMVADHIGIWSLHTPCFNTWFIFANEYYIKSGTFTNTGPWFNTFIRRHFFANWQYNWISSDIGISKYRFVYSLQNQIVLFFMSSVNKYTHVKVGSSLLRNKECQLMCHIILLVIYSGLLAGKFYCLLINIY